MVANKCQNCDDSDDCVQEVYCDGCDMKLCTECWSEHNEEGNEWNCHVWHFQCADCDYGGDSNVLAAMHQFTYKHKFLACRCYGLCEKGEEQ